MKTNSITVRNGSFEELVINGDALQNVSLNDSSKILNPAQNPNSENENFQDEFLDGAYTDDFDGDLKPAKPSWHTTAIVYAMKFVALGLGLLASYGVISQDTASFIGNSATTETLLLAFVEYLPSLLGFIFSYLFAHLGSGMWDKSSNRAKEVNVVALKQVRKKPKGLTVNPEINFVGDNELSINADNHN